jgi:hypothetical protein
MTTKADFAQWLDAYEHLYETPSDLPVTPCPHCGVVGQLRLLFVLRDEGDETAQADFWCDACLVGMMPLRAPLPTDGEIVRRGQEDVPDYRLVVPDPSDEA